MNDAAYPAWIPLEPEHLQLALQHLPVALALLGPGEGVVWRNDRFDERFDPLTLPLPRLLGQADGSVITVVPGRQQAGVPVRACVLELASQRLLMLDEAPGGDIGHQMARLASHVAELEREVMVDPLTGAWNRRYLDRGMTTEIIRSRRYCQPLSAAMIDLDHFKRINDRHGHAVGDAVLREFAQVAAAHMRMADTFCRWGGEEFVYLLPYTPHRGAAAAARKLRATIAQHRFAQAGLVTVSIGVAELLPNEDAHVFFARLDAQLYLAKEGGRDRVVCDPRGASDTWKGDGRGLMSLTWHESYASGHRSIDAEHRELFRLANAVIAASLRDEPEVLAGELDRCLAHIAFHFEHEESILEQLGYAALEQHRGLHRELLERGIALRGRLQEGAFIAGALVEFLSYEVVARHLLKADRDFFPLVAEATGRPARGRGAGPTQ